MLALRHGAPSAHRDPLSAIIKLAIPGWDS